MNKKKYIKNRRLFFLLSFFIILPILMVTVFYVNTYHQNNGVKFEESGTKITNFTKLNLTTDEDDYQVLEAETNELVIHIRLDDITTESNENEDFLRYA